MRQGIDPRVDWVCHWILAPLLLLAWGAGWLAVFAYGFWFFWYAPTGPRMIVLAYWRDIPASWHGEVLIALGVVTVPLLLYIIVGAAYDIWKGNVTPAQPASRSSGAEFGFEDAVPAMDIDSADLG